MKTSEECVLLVCLHPEDSEYIRGLISSFEIRAESLEICGSDFRLPNAENISLAVLHLDENDRRPERKIRQLRRVFSRSVPILLLIPPALTADTDMYLRSGADDYWVLPLDETAFSVRFYVLLEYGQSILHSPPPGKKEDMLPALPPEASVLQRIIARFQDSLRYFSPKLIMEPKDGPIARKWEKIRLLGAGGFGEVWLVRRTGKDIRAVAKIPHSEKMNISALRSAAILKRMSVHPNVVHLLEVTKEEGKVILIQEYIEGETLQVLLEQGIKRVEKEKIFLQLLSVMCHAHEHRIMHRDIKPENMIIQPSGSLKLIDFGIAKDLSHGSPGTSVVGSWPFMSPEQIMGNSCLASDVWAMGVLLYLFYTERLPFYTRDEKDQMDMILEMPVQAPRQVISDMGDMPDISDAMEAVIMKSLDKDPEKRYRDAMELRKDLLRNVSEFGKEGIQASRISV